MDAILTEYNRSYQGTMDEDGKCNDPTARIVCQLLPCKGVLRYLSHATIDGKVDRRSIQGHQCQIPNSIVSGTYQSFCLLYYLPCRLLENSLSFSCTSGRGFAASQ